MSASLPARCAWRNATCRETDIASKPLRGAGTSQILEGLMARRGLGEPREGIGLWMFDAEKH
jgi:hypothetical protein